MECLYFLWGVKAWRRIRGPMCCAVYKSEEQASEDKMLGQSGHDGDIFLKP